ncbi:hypothetical protein ACNUDN_21790 [Mycobacterium sp. smrl_JER01]|uniref:hypothetical protein n=1 Tax=Mycobacterium sp. smrl_JER01 TaxID=3402633 RepID=UPI003AC4F22D
MTESSKRPRDLVNRVFGADFSEVSPDEREPISPDDAAAHERWLRDNIPPHHD